MPIGPIQVVPPGLLGLLQLKQMGALPGQLSEIVTGVIELRDWYLTARRVDEIALFGATPTGFSATTGSQGFVAFGGAVPAVVPAQQFWWVEQYSIDAIIGTAADTIRFAPSIVNGQNTSHQQVGPDVNDVITARARVITGAAWARGFWAFPGDQFAVTIFDVLSAGGITLRPRIRATICPA